MFNSELLTACNITIPQYLKHSVFETWQSWMVVESMSTNKSAEFVEDEQSQVLRETPPLFSSCHSQIC